jgi:hypothetical protein
MGVLIDGKAAGIEVPHERDETVRGKCFAQNHIDRHLLMPATWRLWVVAV